MMTNRKKLLNAKFDKILNRLFWIETAIRIHKDLDHNIRTADLLSKQINDLPLSQRTKNVLYKNNIRNFSDILNRRKIDFYMIKWLWKKWVNEIDYILESYYLPWKKDN